MKKMFLFVAILANMFISCDKNEPEKPVEKPNPQTESPVAGRFDNAPFQWDVVYAPNHPVDDIFIGSHNLFSPYGIPSQVKNKDIRNAVDSYRGADTFILNPVGIYVGATYPAAALNNSTFDQDITKPKNQTKLVYDFADPFLDKVDNIDLFEYKYSLKKAVNSEEFKKQQQASKEQLEYYFTEFTSYSDIEKSFEGDVKLGKIFSAKVNYNSKKTNVKGRLMAKLISKNFSVVMATPPANTGFFQDATYNAATGWGERNPPVYVKSITYGKVAFVAIESEYSYSEVKKALEAGISYKFVSANINMDQKTKEIFSKSTITILAINDDMKDIAFSNSIEALNKTISLNYSPVSYGVPIYYQGRYVTDNRLFTPAYQREGSGRNNDGGRRGGRR